MTVLLKVKDSFRIYPSNYDLQLIKDVKKLLLTVIQSPDDRSLLAFNTNSNLRT